MKKKNIFIYNFENKSGFCAFNTEQKNNCFLTGSLLYATTLEKMLNLLQERIKNCNNIYLMQFNKNQKNYEKILIKRA